MKTTSGSIEPLPTILQELVSRLDSDDWIRRSTSDGTSFYYILGIEAWNEEQESKRDFNSLLIPGGPYPTSPLREYEVHSQVAAPKPAEYYVRRAQSQLVACGVPPAL